MEKYNGWTNYETWRVNLELFDGYEADINENTPEVALADELKEIAEELVGNDRKLCHDYAMAFLSNVNWYEIAEAVLEYNNDLVE